jgi:hypothetical protein
VTIDTLGLNMFWLLSLRRWPNQYDQISTLEVNIIFFQFYTRGQYYQLQTFSRKLRDLMVLWEKNYELRGSFTDVYLSIAIHLCTQLLITLTPEFNFFGGNKILTASRLAQISISLSFSCELELMYLFLPNAKNKLELEFGCLKRYQLGHIDSVFWKKSLSLSWFGIKVIKIDNVQPVGLPKKSTVCGILSTLP